MHQGAHCRLICCVDRACRHCCLTCMPAMNELLHYSTLSLHAGPGFPLELFWQASAGPDHLHSAVSCCDASLHDHAFCMSGQPAMTCQSSRSSLMPRPGTQAVVGQRLAAKCSGSCLPGYAGNPALTCLTGTFTPGGSCTELRECVKAGQ